MRHFDSDRPCSPRASFPASLTLAVLAILFLTSSAFAQITRVANTTLTLPQNPQTFGYSTEDAFAGLTFDQPLAIVTPPGETDRIFIVEKTGRIQVVSNLNTTPTKQLFLDLSARVLTSSEQGTLGLAFHPNFATNHYFYVFYSLTATTSAGTGAHQRVARFTALTGSPTNAQLLATEMPLISQYDQADNHNGGDLHFGPDGYLYISVGDEGGGGDSFNNSQRIDKDYFSGLLRIDVDQRTGNLAPNAHPSVHVGTYLVPADNPFVGATTFNGLAVTPANVRTEFWAVGLRNPWRFSFDAPTGRLLLGDVGQSAHEEIDLITRGANYGWNFREGFSAYTGTPPVGAVFTNPLWDADRSIASSITGGVVYRGTRFAQLFGRYVFGDYGAGRLFFMTFPESGPVQVENSISVSGPVGFGADPRNGDVLIASISTGRILRLVYNSTPTGTALPATLTATGAFSNLATLTPAAGVVAYQPNVTFWSDYAKKRRWFSVPALANKITFAAEGNWTFPAGTVWVKHFDLELTRGDPSTARRLETRFIVKTATGVYGVTYKWNPAQTEATLVAEAGETETISINDSGTIRSQTWRYPSRAECLQCHTQVGGHALSFNTAQLNGTVNYGGTSANQLAALAAAGYFTTPTIADPSTLRALAPANDTSATLEHRARSYLAANCVQCHQPGGAALGNWDARIATPTASTGLINGTLIDNRGDTANRVIAVADPAHSVMLARISTRGPGQMPPLASNELDTVNIALLTSWINALGTFTITTQPQSTTVLAGSSTTLSVVASGLGTLTYQWQKNTVNISGATNASYTIANTANSDAGSYTVTVTSSAGTLTTNPAILTINALPIFTTQPLSQPTFAGTTVNLIAAASGNPTPTYQWQKGGVDISGATGSTLTLSNVQLTDAASYAVIATNTVGSATSSFARLVVLVSQPNAITYATTASSTGTTAGRMVNLAYFMTNVGTRTWGANHYLSIRDSNNTFVAFASLIGTLPGETTTATLNFPAPTTPGTYTYYVQALENGVEFFSTQTTITLTVLAPLANSITYNTTTFPVSAAPGSIVIFTYNVTNTGTASWGATHLLSLKNNSGTTLSSTPLTVLAPGASKTVNLRFTAPNTPGTYNYTVQASQTGVGNFNTQANLTLTVLAPRTNAIVYTATRFPDEVVPGANLNLSYSLSNAGTQTWGSGHYASLRDANGTFLAFLPLNGVAPGGSTTAAFNFTAPSTPGLYTYYVQALENGIEFFSTQNILVVTTVTTPLANAIAYNATTFPATVAPGATVSFTYNVTNRGTKTWGATDFLSFRDVDNTFLGFPSISGVAPGASKTVNFSFTAPTTPGIYTYKAQALQDGVAFYAMDDTLVLVVQ